MAYDPSASEPTGSTSDPAADLLPPVQPPSAGFLMQLFVIPMIIVVIIVMVCLMFNWLAHLGTEPVALVDDLAKLNEGSWQKAHTIANLLCDRRQAQLRQDPALANRLAQILDQEIERASMTPDRIKLRVYLCRALGVFEVDQGVPVLIEAATTERDPAEIAVRRAALESVARLADNLPEGPAALRERSSLTDAIHQCATQSGGGGELTQERGELRATAAYVLGVLGGPTNLDQLARMLSDPVAAVRYNATTGLARAGDDRCIPRISEMLDLDQILAESTGIDEQMAPVILKNGLRAVVQLVEHNQRANLSPLKQLVQSLRTDEQLEGPLRRVVEIEGTLAWKAIEQAEAAIP